MTNINLTQFPIFFFFIHSYKQNNNKVGNLIHTEQSSSCIRLRGDIGEIGEWKPLCQKRKNLQVQFLNN